MSLPDLDLVVLDTETTGFIPKVNRVIEFASVRVRDGEVIDTYEQLISIPDDVPQTVQVLTRIKPDSLAGKPPMDEVRESIAAHIGDNTLIVGQNVGFDIRMLRGEGIDLSERPWIDTSMLASLVFPELASYSLGYMSVALNLDHAPVHRALGDVRATLQMLERCWDRLLELPPDLLELARLLLGKSSPGYALLANALPQTTTVTNTPGWLTMPTKSSAAGTENVLDLPLPDVGQVDLITDELHPDTLQRILNAAAADTSKRHWIGVKNVDATVRRLRLPKEARVLYPPFLLLDHDAAARLAAQTEYTSDEATLALKLAWYEPQSMTDLPIHGDERAVWSGKLACTDQSATYQEQFKNLPTVVLLDHRQLLAFLADPDHEAHGALTADAHVIVDDASMLEDTATRAYGQFCDFDALRAAAEGDPALTGLLDACQIWVERVRQFQDIRYFAPSDFGSAEAETLRDRLNDLLAAEDLPELPTRQLKDLQKILDPARLENRITWIEQRNNGSQFLQSAPERIGPLLKEHLFDRYPTTLLVPPGGTATFGAILPVGAKTRELEMPGEHIWPVPFICEEGTLDALITDPPPGKTVALLSSKRLIEDAFVKHTEALEAKGVTLICQGLGGGQERMQSEFAAAEAPAVWLLTPWTYETVELPRGTIDHLALFSLPFDHPSHPIIGKRCEHFKNGFEQYSLPRLMHRLFRLLRAFARHRTDGGTMHLLDDRVRAKEYGRRLRTYLETITDPLEGTVEPTAPAPAPMKKQPATLKPEKMKGKEGQLPLF